jgi:hypothetical protein
MKHNQFPAFVSALGFLFAALPLAAQDSQNWSVTAFGGFGLYHPVSLTAPFGSASAAPGSRIVLGAFLGRRLTDRFTVEAGWTYQDGDFQIMSGPAKTAFDADADAFHAGLLYYLRSSASRLRPYLVASAGAKLFHGTETPSPRPLEQFAVFHDGFVAEPLLTYGGGLEYSFNHRWAVRLDLRDYTTPFPTGSITPSPGVSVGGWMHDFVPTIGVVFR